MPFTNLTMNAAPSKILIVDDEPDILEFIQYNLKKRGYDIETAINGQQALVKAQVFLPDLILLDVMMPQKDGHQTLKELKEIPALEHTPILFLTALAGEQAEIDGLIRGADDYLTKPVKPELLITRIETALRRSHQQREREQIYRFPGLDLEINLSRYQVIYKQQEIPLAKKEFELLSLLASKPGRVFLRQEILHQVWGTEVIVGDRTIDVHVRKIRQKLGADLIRTVKGVGYKLEIA